MVLAVPPVHRLALLTLAFQVAMLIVAMLSRPTLAVLIANLFVVLMPLKLMMVRTTIVIVRRRAHRRPQSECQ